MSLWAATTKPTSSSIWVMAWCRPAGSGMYGRVTSVGYQKGMVAGLSAVKPASASSCAAAPAVERRDQRGLVDSQLDRATDIHVRERGVTGLAVVRLRRVCRRRVL